jgi:hypothetical protein
VACVAGQRAHFVMAMMDDAGQGVLRPHGVLVQVEQTAPVS